MRKKSGYTLLEVSMSMAILSVVSLLTFVALKSGADSNTMNGAKEQLAADLRDTLTALTREVRVAYTDRTVKASPPKSPVGALSVAVTNSGKGLTYYVPVTNTASPIPVASTPITITYENEDKTTGTKGKLDSGEDTNNDKVLTRRLVRTQGSTKEFLGSANNISNVTFSLVEDISTKSTQMTTLLVQLEASRLVTSGGKSRLITAAAESRITMEN